MNTKWFSGIGLAVLLGTGALIYTTKTQARPSAATAAKSDATLENLTICATEKNPAYLESVLKGAMQAFDKDSKAALKAGAPAEFKKASKHLLAVIKFLFAQSKHFSPIYKNAAHKPAFDKDMNKLIQTLFKAQYALAKSKSAKKEVVKDYTLIVAELKKVGLENLTPITAPKATKSTLSKLKDGLSTAGAAIAEHSKKVASGDMKPSSHVHKALMGAGAVAISGGSAAAIAKAAMQPEDDAPTDDGASNDDADTEEAPTNDDAPTDDGASNDDGNDDEAESDAPTDDGASDDGASNDDADTEEAPTDEEEPDDDSNDTQADAADGYVEEEPASEDDEEAESVADEEAESDADAADGYDADNSDDDQ